MASVAPTCRVPFDATDFGRLGRFFDALPTPIDHLLVTGPSPYYAPSAEFDLDAARRGVDAHLLLPPQVARDAASKVRPGGTLLFMGSTGGRRTAAGLAFIAALTAALPAMTKSLALGSDRGLVGVEDVTATRVASSKTTTAPYAE